MLLWMLSFIWSSTVSIMLVLLLKLLRKAQSPPIYESEGLSFIYFDYNALLPLEMDTNIFLLVFILPALLSRSFKAGSGNFFICCKVKILAGSLNYKSLLQIELILLEHLSESCLSSIQVELGYCDAVKTLPKVYLFAMRQSILCFEGNRGYYLSISTIYLDYCYCLMRSDWGWEFFKFKCFSMSLILQISNIAQSWRNHKFSAFLFVLNTVALLAIKKRCILQIKVFPRTYNLIMQSTIEKIDLRPGNYYQIIHAATRKALMMVEQKSNQYKDRSPVLGEPNSNNLNQVWMIQYIRQKKLYQLVHALSTLVLQSTPKSVKLVFGNWGQGQHYNVKICPKATEINVFQIRDKDNEQVFLFADVKEGRVQIGEKLQNAEQTKWILKIAEKTRAITQSVLFQNAFTNMTIDVPQASSKQGVKLIQYPINKRFNQRFKLVFNKEANTYFIQNVKSRLVVDIKDKNEKQGASIIQWQRNGGLNQQWYLQNQGKDLYLIRSAMKPDLFIGIKHNEFKQAAELVTTKRYDFALWRILGEFDRPQYTLV